MNDLMSFGAHRIWKKKFIQSMQIHSNELIIDMGSGTGDIAKNIKEKIPSTSIISVDLNLKMLEFSQKKLAKISKKIFWINSNAETLPFSDNLFDKYIISFCLRNITNIEKALYEAKRILKPGGIFYCLEFSTPRSPIVKILYNLYKSNIIPNIGKYAANNKDAYRYLEESISQFPKQEILSKKLNQIGYTNVSVIDMFNGIVAIHKGFKT